MDSSTVRKNRIIFTLLLIASFVVLTLALRDVKFWPLKVAHDAVTAVIQPFQKAASAVATPVIDTFSNLSNLSTLRKDNIALKAELARLRHENALLVRVEEENARLRLLMGEKRRTRLPTVPAHVIAVLGPWQSSVVLDKGKADGVDERMPAIATGGVAGQVIEARSNSAVVRLINDPRNGVAVEIKRTGQRCILEGEVGGELRLRLLPRNASVRKGDLIITSGLGGIYPRGLVVGRVREVRRQPTYLESNVLVTPAAPLDRLADVLIIKKGK